VASHKGQVRSALRWPLALTDMTLVGGYCS
jgi:hypothetical protein